MKISFLIFAIALGLGTIQSGAVLAQDDSNLTADQIAKKLKDQLTRGLVIAPGTDQGTMPAAGEAAGTGPAPGTFVELAKEDQVNIQIHFDFDSAKLKDSEKPELVALCAAMKAVDAPMFRVVGHTDASGTAAYNEKLSLARAEEVKDHLVQNCGIPADHLEAVGVGEAFPYDKDHPLADANRRVEFQAMS